MRGLLVGRFQPFHEGHLALVEQIADEADELIVGIGSAERSHTLENPFTGGERVRMISNVLAPVDARAYPIPIRDVGRNAVWVRHVRSTCPRFDAVYTNNPLVEGLFREDGFDVRGTSLYERDQYSGTEIRRRIVEDEEWAHLVPDPVRTVITDVEGVERLRRISVHADGAEADSA